MTIYNKVRQKTYVKETKKDIKITIRLDESIREEYHAYCKDNGYSLSKRVRLLLDKDIQGKLTIEK